jgi:hypothetical protein
MQALHNSAFWVYGVILGFSIREVLSKVVPDLLLLPIGSEPLPASWFVHLEIFRALTFIFLTVTLYFSSARYFQIVYLDERDPAVLQARKIHYANDIISGLIRVLLFYAWSLTVADRTRIMWGGSHFLFLLGVVLLFNYVLLLTNLGLKEHHVYGVIMATFSFVVAASLFFIFRWTFDNDIIAEEAACVPVFITYFAILVENLADEDMILSKLRGMLNKLADLLNASRR